MASVRSEVERVGVAPNGGSSGERPADGAWPGAAHREDDGAHLKHHLHQRLLATISARRSERLGEPELRSELVRLAEELAGPGNTVSGLAEQKTLIDQVLDEVLGCGP